MDDMGVDATTAQWLTSGYSLAEAVVIPMSAYLIGRFTTCQLFIGAISIFAAGSIVATFSSSFWMLLCGRVMQAVCTGMAMPMVITVILLVFPREKRGTASGVIGLVIEFAPAVGPSISGLLVDTVGWRVLFGIISVLALLVIALSALTLRNHGNFRRLSFDPPSVILATFGLACLLYGLSTFATSDNMASIILLIAIGLALLAFYVRRQFKLPEPMLNVRILKTRSYATSVAIIVIVQAALMGTGVITPLYIQGVRGFSATMSGIAMLPGAVIGAVAGLLAGRLFDKHGVRMVAIPGILIALAGGGALGTALIVSISAMAPAFAPEATALEQSYLGDHLAFCATAALMVVATLGILLFARTSKRAKGAPEPISYEAGMDGVTVDVSLRPPATTLDGLTAADVMNPHPIFVKSNASMREVMTKMARNDTSGITVIDSKRRPLGFVTDGDVSAYLGSHDISLFDPQFNFVLIEDSTLFRKRLEALFELNVMQIATKQAISLDAVAPLDEVCRVLGEKRIKKAPVLQNGILVGTISRKNIVSTLSHQFQDAPDADRPKPSPCAPTTEQSEGLPG